MTPRIGDSNNHSISKKSNYNSDNEHNSDSDSVSILFDSVQTKDIQVNNVNINVSDTNELEKENAYEGQRNNVTAMLAADGTFDANNNKIDKDELDESQFRK